jgi:hypothetical protein
MTAAIIGLVLGLVIGAGCRYSDIPSPAPPQSDRRVPVACDDLGLRDC